MKIYNMLINNKNYDTLRASSSRMWGSGSLKQNWIWVYAYLPPAREWQILKA